MSQNKHRHQQEEQEAEPTIPLQLRFYSWLNSARRVCYGWVKSRWYNYASLAVISFNSFLLTLHRYDTKTSSDEDTFVSNAVDIASASSGAAGAAGAAAGVVASSPTVHDSPYASKFFQLLPFLNHACILIFFCELVIKLIAVGIKPFLKNPWDVMDLLVIVFSAVSIFVDDMSNVSSLRVLRWLMLNNNNQHQQEKKKDASTQSDAKLHRAEAFALGVAPAPLRVVTETVFASLQGIFDVMLLSAVFILLFAVAGLQVWGGGLLNQRCYITNATCESGFDYLRKMAPSLPVPGAGYLSPHRSRSTTNNNNASHQVVFPILLDGLADISACGETLKCPTFFAEEERCLKTECLNVAQLYTLPYRNMDALSDSYVVMFNTFLTNDWSIDWEWLLQATGPDDFYIILFVAYLLAYVGNYVGQSLYLCVVANVYSMVAPEFLHKNEDVEPRAVKTSIAWISTSTKTVTKMVKKKKKKEKEKNENEKKEQENQEGEQEEEVEVEVEEEEEEEEETAEIDCDALLAVPSHIQVEDLQEWCQTRQATRREAREFNDLKKRASEDDPSLNWFSKVQAGVRLGHEDKRHISRCVVGFVVTHPVWELLILLCAFACTVVLIFDNPSNSFLDPHDAFSITFKIGTCFFIIDLVGKIFAFGFISRIVLAFGNLIEFGILLRSILLLFVPDAEPGGESESAVSGVVQSIESTMRLCFVVKFIHLVPPLRRMFHVAFRSIRSIAYLSILSILVIFVFSIIGYHAFGDLTNFGGSGYPLRFDSWLQSFYLTFIVATGDIVVPYLRYTMRDLPVHTRWMAVFFIMAIYYSLRGLVVNITACIAIEDVYTTQIAEDEQIREMEIQRSLEAQALMEEEIEEKKQERSKKGQQQQQRKFSNSNQKFVHDGEEGEKDSNNHHDNDNNNDNENEKENEKKKKKTTKKNIFLRVQNALDVRLFLLHRANDVWQRFMDLITGHIDDGPPPLLLPPTYPKSHHLNQQQQNENEGEQEQELEDISNNNSNNNNNNNKSMNKKNKVPSSSSSSSPQQQPQQQHQEQKPLQLGYLSPLFQLKERVETWKEFFFETLYHHPPMFEIHRVFVPPKEKSLNLFLPNADVRRGTISLVFHPFYRWFSFLCVLANLLTFLVWPTHAASTAKWLEWTLNFFFVFDFCLQVVSFGLIFPSATTWSFTNVAHIPKRGSYVDGIAGYMCSNLEHDINDQEASEHHDDEDHQTPLRLSYLSDLFNVFDAIGAFGSLCIFAVHPSFRILRSMRVARMLTLVQEGSTTFVAFCRALPVAATKILPLGIVIFTFIGVWGVELFQGKMGTCNDRNVTRRDACVGTFLAPSPISPLIDPGHFPPTSPQLTTSPNPATAAEFILGPSKAALQFNASLLQDIPRKWQIASYNFETLAEAFMCIFVISGWASTSDILFNTWNAAPNVDEAMSAGASPLGPLYIVLAYFVACVFTANCMCGFLMYYLLEYRKHYDETLSWLPEQRMALRQSNALRSLLLESDIRDRSPEEGNEVSEKLHKFMRFAPKWFLEQTRWVLDPYGHQQDLEEEEQEEKEGENGNNNRDNSKNNNNNNNNNQEEEKGEKNQNSAFESKQKQKQQQQQQQHEGDRRFSLAASVGDAVKVFKMFKSDFSASSASVDDLFGASPFSPSTSSTTPSSTKQEGGLNWSSTDISRVEGLSIFDALVYLVVLLNFIANASKAALSPQVGNAIIRFTILFFIVELSMRFAAYRHHIKNWQHVASREWLFDFIITLAALLAEPGLNWVPYCGLISFLRILKWKTLLGPRLGFIRLWEATENAHKHIWGSLLIIGLGFFFFAVVGVELLNGTVVPPLTVGWNTAYRNMNFTPSALKLLFDANSGDNWIDFPTDYIVGYFPTATTSTPSTASTSAAAAAAAACTTLPSFLFGGNHKVTDANLHTSSTEDLFASCGWGRNNKELVRLYFVLSDVILSIVGPAFVGAVMYDALVLGQDEVEDRCRTSLLRFHKCWIQGNEQHYSRHQHRRIRRQQQQLDKKKKKRKKNKEEGEKDNEKEEEEEDFDDDYNTWKRKNQESLSVGEFIRRVLTRLPRDITNFAEEIDKVADEHEEMLKHQHSASKFGGYDSSSSSSSDSDSDSSSSDSDNDDESSKNEKKKKKKEEKEKLKNQKQQARHERSMQRKLLRQERRNKESQLLPRPRVLLNFLLRTPIPLREGNVVSFDGCLSAIIIAGYKLSGPKAERVLGARAFGQLARLLHGCKVFTVAHFVAVRIIWYYWLKFKARKERKSHKKQSKMILKEERSRNQFNSNSPNSTTSTSPPSPASNSTSSPSPSSSSATAAASS